MKLRDILGFIAILFLVGCGHIKSQPPQLVDKREVESSSSNVSIINEQNINSMFFLGMDYEVLLEQNLYNTEMEITETSTINDNVDSWDYGNKAVWTSKSCMLFDKSDILYSITVNGDIPTSLGLKKGDGVDTLLSLYGKDYKQYDYNWGKVFEYKIGDHYFAIALQENIVLQWSISKYQYDYNGENE